MAVLWRLRYKLGFRDVAELLVQRGYEVGHETIRIWEFRFAPMVSKLLRNKRRGQAGRSLYIDETYVTVTDSAFTAGDPLFDSRDLVQVKYGMLRRVRQAGQPVSETAKAFDWRQIEHPGLR